MSTNNVFHTTIPGGNLADAYKIVAGAVREKNHVNERQYPVKYPRTMSITGWKA
jgi:hypothetical protein